MLHGKPEKDWAQSAVFYQIYPMGFCGAPFENDGVAVNRIQKVKKWIPHLEKLGIGAIYFSPHADAGPPSMTAQAQGPSPGLGGPGWSQASTFTGL